MDCKTNNYNWYSGLGRFRNAGRGGGRFYLPVCRFGENIVLIRRSFSYFCRMRNSLATEWL